MFYSNRKLKIKNAKYHLANFLLVALIIVTSACKKEARFVNPKSEPDTCNNTFYKKIIDQDSSLRFQNIIETTPNHLLYYNIDYGELTEVDSFFNVNWKKTYKGLGIGIGNYDFLFEPADSGNYFLSVPDRVVGSLIIKVDADGNQMDSVKTLSKVKRLSNGELVSYQTPGLSGGLMRIFELNKFDVNLNLAWHYNDTTLATDFVFTEGISDLYFSSERNFIYSPQHSKSTAHLLKMSKEGIVLWEKDYQVNAASTNQVLRTVENADKTLSIFLFDGDYKYYRITADSLGNVISTTLDNFPNSNYIIVKQYGNIKLELDNSIVSHGFRLMMYLNNSLSWYNDYKLNVETYAYNVLQSTTGSFYIYGTVELYDGIAIYPISKPFVIKTNTLGKTCF